MKMLSYILIIGALRLILGGILRLWWHAESIQNGTSQKNLWRV